MQDAVNSRILPVANRIIELRASPGRGRGVFARESITPGTLIEAAPVIILPTAQLPAFDATVVYDYYFHWDGDPEGQGRGAIGLGLVTLCNHSNYPRARVDRNYSRLSLDLIAIEPIPAGEEITIDYNCALWFESR